MTIILTAVIVGVMMYFMPQPFYGAVSVVAPSDAQVAIFCRTAQCQSSPFGAGCVADCNVESLSVTYALCSGVDGISARFKGDADCIGKIAKRLCAREVSRQILPDVEVACFYSASIRGYVMLEGKRVNLQIAYANGTVTVGYPLILGDY